MSSISGAKVTLEVGGLAQEAYVSSAKFSAASADGATFAEATRGGRRTHTFAGTALQDDGSDTNAMATFALEHAGEEITVIYAPQGNEEPSPEQPHWKSTALVPEPDGDWLGGDANPDKNNRYTFDFSWSCTKPVKITDSDS